MDHRGIVRFSVFELDLERGELRKSGRRVPLQQQPWRALVLLATHPGRLVTRDEIRQAVWPEGTHVDFERGINFCLNQVRNALGDPARASHFIETLPRQGYRFVADVRPASATGDANALAPTALAPTALAPTALAPTALAPTALAPTALAPTASPRAGAPRHHWWLLVACAAGLAATNGDVARTQRATPPAAGLAQATAQAALARVMLGQSETGARPPGEVMPRARAAALAALREDPRSADARVSLALVKLHYDWDWEAAEDIERALALAPELPRAHWARAAYWSARGQHDDAIASARQAVELDPMCPTLRGDLGWYYYCARRFPEAAEQWRMSLTILGDGGPRDRLVDALRHDGRTDEAWQEAEATMRHAAVPEAEIAGMAGRGPGPALRAFLSGSAVFLRAHGTSPVRLAALHAAAGEDEQALDLLERAASTRAWGLVGALAGDPDLARLERHPRYLRLLRETGLRGPMLAVLFAPAADVRAQ